MLKRVLAKFRPSPASSMAVALLALVGAFGGVGYAANGAAFILGVINGATQQTALTANYDGSALQLTNTSAGASATALTLTVAAGHPPMKVNTVTKVVNLNADYLDGLNSTTLTRVANVPYNLAPGAVSAPIAVPLDRPVQLVGVSLTGPIYGMGQASLLRSSAGFLQWVGFSYYDPAISLGNSTVAGTRIVYLGTASYVYVETAGPSAIRVHNNSGLTVTGSVSLMW